MDRNRRYSLRTVYGIEPHEYEAMLAEQDGKCAMKSCPNRAIHIDHDHKTGKVRGILCRQCNSVLGMAADNLDILRDAVLYLEEARQKKLKGGTRLPPLPRPPMKEEHRELLRGRMRGNKLAKGIVPHNRGKKASKALRSKLSKARKGWWASLSEEKKQAHRDKGRAAAMRRWEGV